MPAIFNRTTLTRKTEISPANYTGKYAQIVEEQIYAMGDSNHIEVRYMEEKNGETVGTGFITLDWNQNVPIGTTPQITLTQRIITGEEGTSKWALLLRQIDAGNIPNIIILAVSVDGPGIQVFFDLDYINLPHAVYGYPQASPFTVEATAYPVVPALVTYEGAIQWDKNVNGDIFNINDSGRVGINTGPDIDNSVILDVKGNVKVRGDIHLHSGSDRIVIGSNDTYDFLVGNVTMNKTRLIIDDGGQVGIATNMPQNTLHVVGTTQLTDRVSVGAGNSPEAKVHIVSEGTGTCPLLITSPTGEVIFSVCDDTGGGGTPVLGEYVTAFDRDGDETLRITMKSGTTFEVNDVPRLGSDGLVLPDQLPPFNIDLDGYHLIIVENEEELVEAVSTINAGKGGTIFLKDKITLSQDHVFDLNNITIKGFNGYLDLNGRHITISSGSPVFEGITIGQDNIPVQRMLAFVLDGATNVMFKDIKFVNIVPSGSGASKSGHNIEIKVGSAQWDESQFVNCEVVTNNTTTDDYVGFGIFFNHAVGSHKHTTHISNQKGVMPSSKHIVFGASSPSGINIMEAVVDESVEVTAHDGWNLTNYIEQKKEMVPQADDYVMASRGGENFKVRMFHLLGGGGGGGVDELGELSDVTLTNPLSGEALVYNSAAAQWENTNIQRDIIVTNEHQFLDAVNSLQGNGGNIWIVGTVRLIADRSLDMHNINVYGLIGEIDVNGHQMIIIGGSPIFSNMTIEDSTGASSSGNVQFLRMDGAGYVGFDNIKFKGILHRGSAPMSPNVEVTENSSQWGSLSFKNCIFDKGGSSTGTDFAGFNIHLTTGPNTYQFNVFISGHRYAETTGSSKFVFTSSGNTPTNPNSFHVSTDDSAIVDISGLGTIAWTASNEITQKVGQVPDQLDYVILSKPTGELYKSTVKELTGSSSFKGVATDDTPVGILPANNVIDSIQLMSSTNITGVNVKVGGHAIVANKALYGGIIHSLPASTYSQTSGGAVQIEGIPAGEEVSYRIKFDELPDINHSTSGFMGRMTVELLPAETIIGFRTDDLVRITYGSGDWEYFDGGTSQSGVAFEAETDPGDTVLIEFGGMAGRYFYFQRGSLRAVTVESMGDYTTMEHMFAGQTDMEEFHCSADLSSVTNFANTWGACPSLVSFPVLDLSNAQDLSYAWNSCSGLTTMKFNGILQADTFRSTWAGCTALTCIDARIDTTASSMTAGMFDLCASLSKPDTTWQGNLVSGDTWGPPPGGCGGSLPVSFTWSPTNPDAGDPVQFTDTTTGAISWQWDFGDGITSTDQNPQHTYTTGGNYTVTLNASDGTDAGQHTEIITVNVVVAVDFTANPTSGGAPLVVHFTDHSTGATSWKWRFGEGSPWGPPDSTLQNPSYTYNNPGSYDVTLEINDTTELTKDDYIVVDASYNGRIEVEVASGVTDLSLTFPGYFKVTNGGNSELFNGGTRTVSIADPTDTVIIDFVANSGGGVILNPSFANSAKIEEVRVIALGNLTSMDDMFSKLSSMTTFSFANQDVPQNIESMARTWEDCSAMTTFDYINTSKVEDFTRTWSGCSALTSFPQIDVSHSTLFQMAWYNCSSLTSFPPIDFTSAGDVRGAWYGCSGLTSFSPTHFDNCSDFTQTWEGCSALTSFPLITTSSYLYYITSAWRNCSSLTEFPNIPTLNHVQYAQNAWENCSSMTKNNYSGHFTNATDMRSMYAGCTNLQYAYIGNTSSCTKFANMFNGCSNLTCLDEINTTNAETNGTAMMFQGCGTLSAPNSTEQINIENGDYWTNPHSCPL